MALSGPEARRYCKAIETRSGKDHARWGYLAPLALPPIFGLFGLQKFRSQPVLRNTVFAGLSGAVVIYGVATKLVGPPGARGNTGALAQH